MGARIKDHLLVTVVALAVALAVADSSVVVLALPDLYRTFDVSIVAVSWTITAYNIAIVVGALAVIPLERKVRGHVLAAIGLAVFAGASLACGLAGSFEVLIVARSIQGLGAAFALAGAVPVLAGIRGSDARAVALWGTAGTIGVALGPALGGLLTQLFSWRSIFLLQAPLAALALVAILDPKARSVEIPPTAIAREHGGRRFLANLGFFALYGALVGALFLAVLLLVVVWGWEPIAGALVVSALPVAAVLVRPVLRALVTWAAALVGGIALAGGLVALALLPAAEARWAAPALAACGLGLGLLGGLLAPAAVPRDEPVVRAATVSIAARHAGFVVALAIIAPVLAANVERATKEATRATTQAILDSPLQLRQKIDVTFGLRDLVLDTPRGEVPDPAVVFEQKGAAANTSMATTRDSVVGAIRDTVTRAFRGPFLIAALFGVAAAIAAGAVAFAALGARHSSAAGASIAVAIAMSVVVLVAAELNAGARDYGTHEYVAPCTAPPDPYPQGKGLDGTLQRISLSAINGAACKLGTTREELLLSLEPKSGFGGDVRWTKATLDDAVKTGLERAIDDADDRNTIPGWSAPILKAAARAAPVDWILGRFKIPFLES